MDIYQFLADHQIKYERFDHPPVYTIADVQRLKPDLPGAQTKRPRIRSWDTWPSGRTVLCGMLTSSYAESSVR